MLAHVAASDDAHGGIGAVLRLGPLLPVLLAGVIATLTRIRQTLTTRTAAAAVASAAAGAIHLALVGDHLADGLAAGLLFAVAGVGQLALAVGVVWQPDRDLWRPLAMVTAVAVTVTYAASRVVSVPLLGAGEPVDALGVVTTALAALAAILMWRRAGSSRLVGDRRGVAVVVVAVVTLAPIVFDVDPTWAEAGIVVLVAAAVGAVGGVGPGQLIWMASDAAVIALVLRGPTGMFVIVGAALGMIHALASDMFRWLPAAAAAIVVVVSVPQLDARLDLLHVGHPDDTVTAVTLFVVAGAFGAAALLRCRVGSLLAAYGALATFEAARLAAGTGSIESIEVFVTSLTLFVLVVPVLLDGTVEGRMSIVAGALTGASIGVLRSVEVAYPIPWGVLAGCAVMAAGGWVTGRRRPLRPVRTARSSAATPRRT